MILKKSEKKDFKLKIGLSGASGFGKTYSSLLLAYGITDDWSKIAVIDSENGSSNLYAHLGDFSVLKLLPPYSPENYIKAIRMCENALKEVIIIDSITHEWKGIGGCLEMHSKLGGRFQDWSKITPRHQAFVDAILMSDSHIITTARRRIEYVMDRDEKGKLLVTKVGTKEETRNGFEYELTVNFELLGHGFLAKTTKDRTGIFVNDRNFMIDDSIGKRLVKWCRTEDEIKEVSST